MFFKILLPTMVGLLVYFLGKSHARRDRQRSLHAPSAQTLQPSVTEKFRTSFRLIAIFLASSAILSAGWFIFESWQESHTVVSIRVINAQTGNSAHYQALKGQVHGRVFTTTDGRQIRLADVERMEMDEGK